MRTRAILLGAAFAYLLVQGAVAKADYEFVLGGGGYYQTTPNTPVTVPIYLQETGTSLLSSQGLIGAGVTVNFNSPSPPFASATSITAGPGFTAGGGTGITPGVANLIESSLAGVTGTLVSPGVYQILVGDVNFTTGSQPGTTTYLSATAYPSAGGSNVLGGGGVLDPLIGHAFGAIMTPEPAGLWCMAVAALTVVGSIPLLRRNRKPRS
jgi:hypothetical protein